MIQILPKHVADLIAAGEVVERPASVVKELCENALDAGATSLTVEIQAGGIKLIRVTDNGHGIAQEDIRTAFLTHATSKISSADDLNHILTLGFRGEALASIAAVARVQLLSRQAGKELGTCYEIEAGEEVGLEDAGCPSGTTMIVRDLFYKTPARMKFLKKDVTEGNFVGAAVERLALSRPDVAFCFIRDGRPVFHSPGDGKAASAVRAVLGKTFYEHMLSTKNTHDGVQVSGFVCKPEAARPNRNQQYFFLNGRYIKCPTASAALGEAYKHSVMAGKFPSCVLYITLPAGFVDVNVHPHKTEVRFADDKLVFSAVYGAACSALRAQSSSDVQPLVRPIVQPAAKPADADVTCPASLPVAKVQLSDSSAQMSFSASEGPSLIAKQTVAPVPSMMQSEERIVNCIELFKTYFLVEMIDEILLIDKHAAHERIIYEQLKNQAGEARRQVLMSPLALNLSREECAVLLQHSELLQGAGFVVASFGENSIVLRECPMLLCGHDMNEQLSEIAGFLLKQKQDITTKAQDWIFHSAACRAAIKAGDPTTQYEREKFVKRLLAMSDIRHCPHGRPVIVTITRKDMEKKFGR